MPRRVPLEDFLDKNKILRSASSTKGRRYEATYDDEEEMLFITFVSPGGRATYGYWPIIEQEARSYFLASSKGKWLWSHVRVRGSKTLHQKSFWKF